MIAKRIAQALRKASGPHSVALRDVALSGGKCRDLLVSYYTRDHDSDFRPYPEIDIQDVTDLNTNDPIDLSPEDEQSVGSAIRERSKGS